MTISIANLHYANAAGTLIDMDVTQGGETFPFTYAADDPAPVSRAVADLLAEGQYEIAAYTPPAPMARDVLAERARRLSLGFDFDFGDARGLHHIGTTEADMRGWDEVSKLASALIALNDTETTITIVTNTGAADVTALEWQTILVAAAQFRQPIWAASFALQAADPIPADFTDDKYWI